MTYYIPPWDGPGQHGMATGFTTEEVPDPVRGDGSTMTCLVFPTNQSALAIKVEGDEYPRWVLASDSVDGFYCGDGTYDPYNSGPSYYLAIVDDVNYLAIGRMDNGFLLNGQILVPLGDITISGGGVILP